MGNDSEENFRKRVTYNPREFRGHSKAENTSFPLVSKSTGRFLVVFLAIAGILIYLFDRYLRLEG